LLTVGAVKVRVAYNGGSGSGFTLTVDTPPTLPTFTDVTRAGAMPQGTITIPFTVTDDLSVPTVFATTSNGNLIPVGGLVVDGTGSGRTIVITPADVFSNDATITVTALDDRLQSTVRTFLLTITDAAPVLAPIPDQTIHTDDFLPRVDLALGDDLTSVPMITLTAVSSNPALIPNSGVQFFVLGGTQTRVMSITPAAHKAGQTLITVTATDNGNQTVSQSFTVTVTNEAPFFDGLSDQRIFADSKLTLPFTAGDPDTSNELLTVTAESSNTGLLPNDKIVIGGTAPDLTLTATTTLGQTGSTVITLTLSDRH